jgi:RimJ/RimL family protein N-acetyltransferase
MQILSTSRLHLRQMTLEDDAFMLSLLNEPSWLRFIGDRGVRTVEQAQAYLLNGAIENYVRLGYGFYLVERKEDGKAIGMCGLAKREFLDYPDLGFAYFPEFNGQGYAYEAAAAVLVYAKQHLGLSRILATTRLDNLRSAQLLEKLGMRMEKVIVHPNEARELKLYATNLNDKAEIVAELALT